MYSENNTRSNGNDFKIVKASANHVDEILKLYQSIQINEKNLLEKINPQHPKNFFKTGGIFDIKNSHDIKQMIASDAYIVRVAISSKSNKVIGYVSCLIRGKSVYDNLGIILEESELTSEEIENFKIALQKEKVAYTIDVIISPDSGSKNVFKNLLSTTMKEAGENGPRYTFFEIATIFHRNNEFNNASMRFSHILFNAKKIGYRYERRNIAGTLVGIKSNYFVVKLSNNQK